MEDLWCVQNSGIELEEFADIVEYKRFLERFRKEEELNNRRRLLYENEISK